MNIVATLLANWRAILIGALITGNVLFYNLWQSEEASFDHFKDAAEAQVEANIERTKVRAAAQHQITEDTRHGYEEALAYLRAYYDRLVRGQPGGSDHAVPGIRATPAGIDEIPADALPLAGQCAETTLMVLKLQDDALRKHQLSKQK